MATQFYLDRPKGKVPVHGQWHPTNFVEFTNFGQFWKSVYWLFYVVAIFHYCKLRLDQCTDYSSKNSSLHFLDNDYQEKDTISHSSKYTMRKLCIIDSRQLTDNRLGFPPKGHAARVVSTEFPPVKVYNS